MPETKTPEKRKRRKRVGNILCLTIIFRLFVEVLKSDLPSRAIAFRVKFRSLKIEKLAEYGHIPVQG